MAPHTPPAPSIHTLNGVAREVLICSGVCTHSGRLAHPICYKALYTRRSPCRLGTSTPQAAFYRCILPLAHTLQWTDFPERYDVPSVTKIAGVVGNMVQEKQKKVTGNAVKRTQAKE